MVAGLEGLIRLHFKLVVVQHSVEPSASYPLRMLLLYPEGKEKAYLVLMIKLKIKDLWLGLRPVLLGQKKEALNGWRRCLRICHF